MPQQEKHSIIDSVLLFVRRVTILSVITAVGALALFWESIPDSVKNTVTLLTKGDYNADDDGMVPHRFRLEKNPETQSDFLPQTSHVSVTHLENITPNTFSPVETGYREYPVTEIDQETLSVLHNELKQFGAISCQLSYWGDKRKIYRFSCKMPISEQNSNVTRMFQSIAPDAAQSMREVVQQVRKWQEKNIDPFSETMVRFGEDLL